MDKIKASIEVLLNIKSEEESDSCTQTSILWLSQDHVPDQCEYLSEPVALTISGDAESSRVASPPPQPEINMSLMSERHSSDHMRTIVQTM